MIKFLYFLIIFIILTTKSFTAEKIVYLDLDYLLSNSNNSSLSPKLNDVLPVPRHTRRIIQERINCPTNKYESLTENNGKTLDDYINKDVCQNYIHSFDDSYI